jgi:L-ascorbate metabolism protein UlaG (beta-lactamase superfamily)
MGDNFNLGPKEALIVAIWLSTNKIIGMHYDTFPYIVIDKEKALRAASGNGFELLLLDKGKKY